MKKQNPKTLKIASTDEGERLDLFLSKLLGCSRNQIKNLIKNNLILCNQSPAKSSHILKTDDIIEIYEFENSNNNIIELFHDDSIDVAVVFEDNDIIVVNKPPGLVTHPGAGKESKSLVHALFNKLPNNPEDPTRPGIVHRLDKDTQGLIVLAKNSESQKNLANQFRNKTARRTYRTICYGKFKTQKGVYETHLKRDPKNRKKYKSQNEGRIAITHFTVINENELSFVELKLETGRTHQIRVHLSEDHHPILNDQIYGHEKRIKEIKNINLRTFIKNLEYMPLVATNLKFSHPVTNMTLEFEVAWPEEFKFENLSD